VVNNEGVKKILESLSGPYVYFVTLRQPTVIKLIC
jgi:hypothetical protein